MNSLSLPKLPPIHPGEILREEFLAPLGISQARLARDINVPARRISEIIHGKRAISPDTALRLSRYFGMSERFWLNLQCQYDLEMAKDHLAGRLDREVQIFEHRQSVEIDPITAKLNEIYAVEDSNLDPVAAQLQALSIPPEEFNAHSPRTSHPS